MLNIFTRQPKPTLHNPLNIQTLFYKQTLASPLHGRLLVDSKIHGLKRKVVDFSLTGLNPYADLPALTPGLLTVIFAQAREAGFTPLSLIAYDGIDIHTGLYEGVRGRIKAFKPQRVLFDAGAESIGLIRVHDMRSDSRPAIELRLPYLAERTVAFTPALLELIFESIKEQGVMPLALERFATHLDQSKHATYYEQALNTDEPVATQVLELNSPNPSNPPALEIPTYLRVKKEGKEKGADAVPAWAASFHRPSPNRKENPSTSSAPSVIRQRRASGGLTGVVTE